MNIKSGKPEDNISIDLFNKIPLGIYRTNPVGKILYANAFLIKMLGYDSLKELLKVNVEKSGYQDKLKRKQFKELIERKNEIHGWECEWLKKDKSVIFVREFAMSIRNNDNQVIFYEGVVEDITEIKKDEQELNRYRNHLEELVEERTSQIEVIEGRYKSLVENISDWIWEVDINGMYIYSSPKIEEILGFIPEEILGKTPFDFIVPEEKESAKFFFSNIVKSQRPFNNFANTNIHKNGKLVFLETSGVPFFDEKGDLLGYRGIDRDVTEHRMIENALRAFERKLSMHIQYSSIGYIEWDSHLEVLEWNPSAERIFGFTKKEAITKNTFQLIFSSQDPKHLESIKKHFLDPFSGKQFKFENTTQGGQNIICNWFNTPLLDEKGRLKGVNSLVHDIII